MGYYSLACYSAVNLANDMKHIHLHAKGPLFDTIHNICNEYYEKANDEADTLAELAIEKDETILNISFASIETNYKPTNYGSYNFRNAMDYASKSINSYIANLEKLRKKTDDTSVQSLLDDIIRYWKKEVDYKMKHRLIDYE